MFEPVSLFKQSINAFVNSPGNDSLFDAHVNDHLNAAPELRDDIVNSILAKLGKSVIPQELTEIIWQSALERLNVKEKLFKLRGSLGIDDVHYFKKNHIIDVEETLLNDSLPKLLQQKTLKYFYLDFLILAINNHYGKVLNKLLELAIDGSIESFDGKNILYLIKYLLKNDFNNYQFSENQTKNIIQLAEKHCSKKNIEKLKRKLFNTVELAAKQLIWDSFTPDIRGSILEKYELGSMNIQDLMAYEWHQASCMIKFEHDKFMWDHADRSQREVCFLYIIDLLEKRTAWNWDIFQYILPELDKDQKERFENAFLNMTPENKVFQLIQLWGESSVSKQEKILEDLKDAFKGTVQKTINTKIPYSIREFYDNSLSSEQKSNLLEAVCEYVFFFKLTPEHMQWVWQLASPQQQKRIFAQFQVYFENYKANFEVLIRLVYERKYSFPNFNYHAFEMLKQMIEFFLSPLFWESASAEQKDFLLTADDNLLFHGGNLDQKKLLWDYCNSRQEDDSKEELQKAMLIGRNCYVFKCADFKQLEWLLSVAKPNPQEWQALREDIFNKNFHERQTLDVMKKLWALGNASEQKGMLKQNKMLYKIAVSQHQPMFLLAEKIKWLLSLFEPQKQKEIIKYRNYFLFCNSSLELKIFLWDRASVEEHKEMLHGFVNQFNKNQAWVSREQLSSLRWLVERLIEDDSELLIKFLSNYIQIKKTVNPQAMIPKIFCADNFKLLESCKEPALHWLKNNIDDSFFKKRIKQKLAELLAQQNALRPKRSAAMAFYDQNDDNDDGNQKKRQCNQPKP